MAQTVAELLVNALERIGVKHIFGLIGDSLHPLADAVRRSGMEWVGVRHEEGGAIVDCVVASNKIPNFPHLELDKIGNYAVAKIKEAMLAFCGR